MKYKVYVVASSTERTAIVIAKSKEDAINTAKRERWLDNPKAYEIKEYFEEQLKYAEAVQESEIWIWNEEEETKTNINLFYTIEQIEKYKKMLGENK